MRDIDIAYCPSCKAICFKRLNEEVQTLDVEYRWNGKNGYQYVTEETVDGDVNSEHCPNCSERIEYVEVTEEVSDFLVENITLALDILPIKLPDDNILSSVTEVKKALAQYLLEKGITL